MRKVLAGAASAAALFLTAAPLAMAAPAGEPNARACANGHGTHVAHATVPHHNTQAHQSIPHFCPHP